MQRSSKGCIGSFVLLLIFRILHGKFKFTEFMVETVREVVIQHSCRSEKLPDKEFSLPQNRQSYSCSFAGVSILKLSPILLTLQHRARSQNLYIILRFCQIPVFLINSQLPPLCAKLLIFFFLQKKELPFPPEVTG